MEITRVVGIGIVGVVAATVVKNHRPELGILIALAACGAIFWSIIPELSNVVDVLSGICQQQEITKAYFKIVIKVIGIAYITQFSVELARDAGEGAIAKKLEFAGKVSVLCIIMPTVIDLLEVITSTLMSF